MLLNAQDAQALVDQGIQQLLDDPEQWKQWADTMAQFPKYSPGNALLILSQRPDATMVAGFHAWQKLDRHVMKGEHGMTIIAPVVRRKEFAIEEAPSPTKSSIDAAPQRQVMGFKAATVFDVSQTDGKELVLPQPQEIRGEAMRELLNHLIDTTVPVPVRFAALEPGTYGMWEPGKGQITLAKTADPDQQFKTLLHEWSHSIGVPDASASLSIHRGTEEVTAETTAYVVAKSLGLNTKAYSMGYVGSWAQGDSAKVAAVTQAVGQRVHVITRALETASERDPVIAQAIAHWYGSASSQPQRDTQIAL